VTDEHDVAQIFHFKMGDDVLNMRPETTELRRNMSPFAETGQRRCADGMPCLS
jgi:hypothetical protein